MDKITVKSMSVDYATCDNFDVPTEEKPVSVKIPAFLSSQTHL